MEGDFFYDNSGYILLAILIFIIIFRIVSDRKRKEYLNNLVLQENATIDKMVVRNCENTHHPKAEIAFRFTDGWLYTTYKKDSEGVILKMNGATTYTTSLSDKLKEEVVKEAYEAHKAEYNKRNKQ